MPSSFDPATVTVESPLDLGSGRSLVRKSDTSPNVADDAGDYKAADVTDFVAITVAAAAAAAGTYIGRYNSTSDLSAYTFSSVPMATAADEELIIFVGTRNSSGYQNPTGVTANAVSASAISGATRQWTEVNFFSVNAYRVTPGATASADIVVTFGATMMECYIAVYRASDLGALLDVATSAVNGTNTLDLDTSAGGLALAFAFGRSGTDHSFSGITENADPGASVYSSGHIETSTTETPRSVSIATTQIAGCVAVRFEGA
jgi:hypothetical protein